MNIFSLAQLQDLRELLESCEANAIDVVIIGSMAYRLFIDDVARETADIDLAVAVDLEDPSASYRMLESLKWQRSERLEQRWQTARRVWVDSLPAGPALRARGTMEWPRSGFVMSLAGFEHGISRCRRRPIGAGADVQGRTTRRVGAGEDGVLPRRPPRSRKRPPGCAAPVAVV